MNPNTISYEITFTLNNNILGSGSSNLNIYVYQIYTITYEYYIINDDGEPNADPTTVKDYKLHDIGIAIKQRPENVYQNGRTFVNWIKKDSDTPYDFGAPYTDNISISLEPNFIARNIIFFFF